MHLIRTQFIRQYSSRTIFALLGLAILIFCIANSYEAKSRPRAINEVPLAFWAWRVNVPNEADIDAAFTAAKAKTLFLRAGQIDFENGEFKRIQAVKGNFPRALELHVVYNATRNLLSEFENLDPEKFAQAITEIYQEDLAQADHDQAKISGIQLDLDIPTRLLLRYAQVLKSLQTLLPPNTKLSITGLPTWANSSDINSVLSVVDFWIPQCYGTEIPNRITKQIPISSPNNVASTINKIRQLKKPFYAGLSAYSYAILYGKNGSLIELRGNLDPAAAAQNLNLELLESSNFKGDEANGERRYVYRAKSDFVLDGVIMKAGESLVFDVPSTESLRECARAVRENAGENLLGICLFRLPNQGDESVLSLREITAALNDEASTVATKITLTRDKKQHINLSAENIGTASAVMGEGAMTVDIEIPAGSFNSELHRRGFTEYETLCQMLGQDFARPCSERRANVIRLKTNSWKPGGEAQMIWTFYDEVPKKIAATVRTKMNDRNVEIEKYETEMRDENEK